jgi:transposase
MLRPLPIAPIPPETARVARAALPTGNRYRRVADALESLLTDEAFLALVPTHGQPALPPWRLALVTLLPCAEGLSDRQAADAVRRRIDWIYGLRLELTGPGCDALVLRALRGRLMAGAAAALLVETWLTWCRNRQLVQARGRQRTDSTPGLAAVRALNRLEVVGATRRHALNPLAVVAPAWRRAASPPADAHPPAPAAISGPPGGPATGSDRGVSGGGGAPRRERRDDCARGPGRTPAAEPRRGAPTGASWPSPDGRGLERAPARRLGPGDRACQDPSLTVCPAASE